MISEDMTDSLLLVLRKLARYYPIGIPLLRDHFSGYQEIIRTVGKKTSAAQEGRLAIWDRLTGRVREQYPSVYDLAFLEEPSLKLVIPVFSKEEQMLERTVFLNLYLSLLVPCYSVFVSERLSSGKDFRYQPHSIKKRIQYGKKYLVTCQRQCLSEKEQEGVDLLGGLARTYYPGHQPIDFQIITDFLLHGAVPFDRPADIPSASHPISHFLYGPEHL